MAGTLRLDHISIGKLGENLGSTYLVVKGYKILRRNYREKWDEIDIISRRKDGVIVFFEVKTLLKEGSGGLVPEDNLTPAKFRKLRRACQMFVAKHPRLIIEKKGWQIDLLAIVLERPDAIDIDMKTTIRHYENI